MPTFRQKNDKKRVEQVPQKNQLSTQQKDNYIHLKSVYFYESAHIWLIVNISPCHTLQTNVMDLPAKEIGSDYSYSKVYIPHRCIQCSTGQAGIKEIDGGKAQENQREENHDMYMRYHEISIMQLNVQGRIPERRVTYKIAG